ncbi:hypothetical protein [Bacillus toyonensis]|uniref:hypothetical protein n=1 Tax=Bacillus toyonensis TaxID=155322 RepID=UPI00211D6E2F|nr:hypothetical protein [Bacillus toyonensis]
MDNSLNKKTFLEIGLWAIPSKRNHLAEVEKKRNSIAKWVESYHSILLINL